MKQALREVRGTCCLSGMEVKYAQIDVLSLEFQHLKDMMLDTIGEDALCEYDFTIEIAAKRRDNNSAQ